MFCPYCGTQLNEGAKFCVSCGRPIAAMNERGAQAGNPGQQGQPQPPIQIHLQNQPVIPPASLLPEGEEAAPSENNTGLVVLIIILVTLIILVGLLAFAYIGGYIDF